MLAEGCRRQHSGRTDPPGTATEDAMVSITHTCRTQNFEIHVTITSCKRFVWEMAPFSKDVQKSNRGDYKQGSAIVQLRTSRFKAKFKMSASVMAACFSCLASAAGALNVKTPKRAKMYTACDINFAASVPEHLESLCKHIQQQERSCAESTSTTNKSPRIIVTFI